MFKTGDTVKVLSSRDNPPLNGKLGTIVEVDMNYSCTVDFHREIYDERNKCCTHNGSIYNTNTYWHFFDQKELELVQNKIEKSKSFNLRNW